MSGRTDSYLIFNITQPPTNSWPVHPHLSCLIPLLPYTNFTCWESHPFRHFSLYNIHFTGMTYLDLRLLEIRKLQTFVKLNRYVKVFLLMILGSNLTRNPCHLSCWINLIYHLNDLTAQFGRVTSNVNHFSFQKSCMIGMPFKTWLLDQKLENDCVTCFGNRTVMNCFLFQPGSGQSMPNTSKYPNHLSSPHQTPSLSPFISDVVVPKIQLRQGGVLFQGLGQRLAGDTWLEKHNDSTHIP